MIVLILILTFFLFMTIINIFTMPRLNRHLNDHSTKISFLLPMRNEETNAEEVIKSILASSHTNKEIIVLNDQSEDETAKILAKFDDQIKVIEGKPLPEDWVGKVFACHQLSEEASGDYFCFIDADVRLHPNAISQALNILNKRGASLITGFPQFPTNSLLAKLLVPLQHFFVFFHLPNIVANHTKIPAFTAAHGAFMLFEKEAYLNSGGHKAVKNSLVEDIHITRTLKKNGYRCILSNISNGVTCDMYDTNKEVWEGFSKNIFTGLGRSLMASIAVSLFYLCFYFLPLPLAIIGLINGDWIWILPLLIIFLQTFLIDSATGQSKVHFIYMPVSAIALVILLISSIIKSINGSGYTWKGRIYR
ncbi:glycosyltransferase [Jeotgalibacillus salarius]|uniref:Glycosyltransferase n=1 Tax=Jeotgalibacillus salarius TaxID=546023 RepID=A0A4Y8LIZ6_9BACL|nr:glycosyltransferase family 2 protein [Jeotgalibacillus salarius]TFE03000.1 glycosyltransferase [Jeotgalibacillus salarius]